MFKFKNQTPKNAMKILIAVITFYFMLSAPASAATTLQEMFAKAKEVLVSFKDLAVYAGVVGAILCIILAGFKLKAKAAGDPQAKVLHVVIFVIAALVLGGGAFWVQSTADSVGVEISSGF